MDTIYVEINTVLDDYKITLLLLEMPNKLNIK